MCIDYLCFLTNILFWKRKVPSQRVYILYLFLEYLTAEVENPVWSCRSVLSPSLILRIYGKLTNYSGELTNMVYSAGWKILLILQVCPLSFSHLLDLREAHKLFWGAHKYNILRDGKYFWSCRYVLSPSLILWIYRMLTNYSGELTNMIFSVMENTSNPTGLSSLLLWVLSSSGSSGSSQIILGSSKIWYSAGWKILLIQQVCPLSFSHLLDLQEAHKLF